MPVTPKHPGAMMGGRPYYGPVSTTMGGGWILPQLPGPNWPADGINSETDKYTAEQMRTYAIAALEADEVATPADSAQPDTPVAAPAPVPPQPDSVEHYGLIDERAGQSLAAVPPQQGAEAKGDWLSRCTPEAAERLHRDLQAFSTEEIEADTNKIRRAHERMVAELQGAVAVVVEELEHDGVGFCAKVRWLFNPVPVGERLHWQEGDQS